MRNITTAYITLPLYFNLTHFIKVTHKNQRYGTVACNLPADIGKKKLTILRYVYRSELSYARLEGDDARKLDRMFNRQMCLIEVNPGRLLLPPKYEELGDRIRAMEVRTSDVWVISYPRTGIRCYMV